MIRPGPESLAFLLLLACSVGRTERDISNSERQGGEYQRRRAAMVDEQLRARGIKSPAVLSAMSRVPRHLMVPSDMQPYAYDDRPLPIGWDQTISQPYIVAYMTEALDVSREEKVLEVGTGSGYQAAVLSGIVREVFSIEIVPELASRAREILERLGYRNVRVRTGDGYLGWPEEAPFDGIVVTAAPDHVPKPLIDQLAVGGRLVIPVGAGVQEMTIVTRTTEGLVTETTIPVRFVPMTGTAVR